MNILVCVKAVAAQPEDPQIADGGFNVRLHSKSFSMNESDEHALERALSLKKEAGGTVTVLTVGSVRSQDVLFRCLGKGADAAIRVDGDEFDANVTALKLARAVGKLAYDVILTGVESLDGMSSQVGLLVAARLGIACAYGVVGIDLARPGTLRVDREIGGGRRQTLEIDTPALLSVQSGSEPPSYPPAAKLIQARRRPIPFWSAGDLGLSENELRRERRLKFLGLERAKAGGTIEWIAGTPEEVASVLITRVRQAL
ncbi:MAG TPA: hypothetical protein VNN77_01345 [candidate division Zixibacteria bacterium]|nr:hypothetical protein [candidate division Zixibacteria bacterium]